MMQDDDELTSLLQLVRGAPARDGEVRRNFPNLVPLNCEAWYPIPASDLAKVWRPDR